MVEISSERADALRNRAAILDVAAEVLAADPGASLAEVASRAGLGRATLYRHFASRDALLAAIREEVLARAGAALATLDLEAVSFREGLRQAAAAHDTTVDELVDHVLREYLRYERLSQLRNRSGTTCGSEFTTWRDQITFTADHQQPRPGQITGSGL